jgi:nicotinamide mononucleotide transporter
MSSFLNAFLESLYNTSVSEIIAVIFGVLYLVLIMYKVRSGWLFAAVSTAIYIVLNYQSKLYIESVLQVFYFAMAFVGFFMWESKKSENLKIYTWSIYSHLKVIGLGTVLCIAVALLFKNFTDQSSPFLDAFTTVFSLIATYLTAKRILSNWIYWIVIDSALVILYYSNNLVLTSYHFGLYILLAMTGYYKWYKYLKVQNE